MNDGSESTRRMCGGRCNDLICYARGPFYRFRAVTDAGREHIGGLEFWDVRPDVVEAVTARMADCGLTVA